MKQRAQINEVYAAVQGEGPKDGTPCVFVRFHLCPVKCQWCDTSYTWDGSEKGERTNLPELLATIEGVARNPNGLVFIDGINESRRVVNHVVITGGEPMVQKCLGGLIAELRSMDYTVEIETACIFKPTDEWLNVSDDGVIWNLSPKLPSANAKILPAPAIVRQWIESSANTELKLVVKDLKDLEAAIELSKESGAELSETLIMPCATSVDQMSERLRWLYPLALTHGFKVISRTHITAYNGKRAT